MNNDEMYLEYLEFIKKTVIEFIDKLEDLDPNKNDLDDCKIDFPGSGKILCNLLESWDYKRIYQSDDRTLSYRIIYYKDNFKKLKNSGYVGTCVLSGIPD